VVAGEAFGVGNDHLADCLVVALVGVAYRILRAGDGQVARGVDRELAFRRHIRAGQRDVVGLRRDGGAAASRQRGAGHGVGGAVAAFDEAADHRRQENVRLCTTKRSDIRSIPERTSAITPEKPNAKANLPRPSSTAASKNGIRDDRNPYLDI